MLNLDAANAPDSFVARVGAAFPVAAPVDGGASVKDVDAVFEVITRYNDKYFVVNEQGNCMVYEPRHDRILNRRFFNRMTIASFNAFHMNKNIFIGLDAKKNKIYKTASKLWLTSPDRKEYIGGIIFDPSNKTTETDTYNLWQGFSFVPKKGDWSLLKGHIHSIICKSNQVAFDFLMGWMARLVQFPGEQGEVAIVLRGGEGAGKGILGRALTKLFGQHGMQIFNAKHLVGNFNGHLRDVVMLFADEAFFAGNKEHEDVLKGMISEPTIPIEKKGIDTLIVPNYLHIIMCSNKDWVIPAAWDSRRYAVNEVDDCMANCTAEQKSAYFTPMYQQMDDGGYAAMLHDLLHYDLTGYNPRAIPDTDGLRDQRKLSMGKAESWWMDVLQRGYVFESGLGLEKIFMTWHDEISTELLYASYSKYGTKNREYRPMNSISFGKFMTKVAQKQKKLCHAAVGEHLTDGINGYRAAEAVIHPRPHGYFLGSLEMAREKFAEAMNMPFEWHDSIT